MILRLTLTSNIACAREIEHVNSANKVCVRLLWHAIVQGLVSAIRVHACLVPGKKRHTLIGSWLLLYVMPNSINHPAVSQRKTFSDDMWMHAVSPHTPYFHTRRKGKLKRIRCQSNLTSHLNMVMLAPLNRQPFKHPSDKSAPLRLAIARFVFVKFPPRMLAPELERAQVWVNICMINHAYAYPWDQNANMCQWG